MSLAKKYCSLLERNAMMVYCFLVLHVNDELVL